MHASSAANTNQITMLSNSAAKSSRALPVERLSIEGITSSAAIVTGVWNRRCIRSVRSSTISRVIFDTTRSASIALAPA